MRSGHATIHDCWPQSIQWRANSANNDWFTGSYNIQLMNHIHNSVSIVFLRLYQWLEMDSCDIFTYVIPGCFLCVVRRVQNLGLAEQNQSQKASRYLLSCALQWRHNGRDSVWNHQPHDCLLKGLFRRRSKKTPKLRVTGLCAGSSPGTGEFPAQMGSNAENVSILWRSHVVCILCMLNEMLNAS